MSIFKRQVHKFCIPLQFHERLFLCIFLVQTIYTLLKMSPLKWKFLGLSSAWVKICQIPYAYFETTSPFISKFCISLQFHEGLLLCTFFSSNNIYFAQKEPIKVKIFETFKHTDQNLSNSLCQFSNDKSINFVSLSSFMKGYFFVFF